MNERHRRGGRRDRRYDEPREFERERSGRDEARQYQSYGRYPDERYGGEQERYGQRSRYGSDPHERWSTQPGRRSESYGPGERRYAGGWDDERGQSRGDWWDRSRTAGGYGSEFGSWQSGASFGFGPEERPDDRDFGERAGSAYGSGRYGQTGYGGSRYGQDSGYGFGDLNTGRLEGDSEDRDWMPNRPARGRQTWAGDWGDQSRGEFGPGYMGSYGVGYGGSYSIDESRGRRGEGMREDFRGRSPKDYRRSDERIREEVCDRLTDDGSLDPSDISVKVEGGEVTLTGFVATRDDKRRAEEDVERVSGVREVINQLRVSRGDGQASGQAASSQAGARSRGGSTTQPSSVAADRDRDR